jgi:ATP-dependent DNA helicase RecQ
MSVPSPPTESHDPEIQIAQATFGLPYLYPYQRLVIANTIHPDEENPNQIVVLATGSGKSLCFTLPALLVDGLTIVVYPLLALMDDQLRRMTEASVPARILRGGQSRSERSEIFAAARSGGVRCLLANPEILAAESVRRELSSIRVGHLVIDEAHCVSEWGETFRPSYLTLRETIAALSPRVVTAFTATASPVVLDAVTRILFDSGRPRLVQGDPDRPNISYSVVHAPSKEAALAELVGSGVERPALVFCRSRKRTEAVARELAEVVGFDRCSAYHAGLTKPERAAVEEWFFASDDGVLAATCAYGMGVDKQNIRTVVHYELPSNVEAFLQESGRAGRDREPAWSIVLWNDSDPVRELEPERAAREAVMRGYLRAGGCRRAYLMDALGTDSSVCFGCDRCTPGEEPGAVVRTRGTMQQAIARADELARRRPRTFTADQFIHRLPLAWSTSARQELLASLVAGEALGVHRRGPWKGRIHRV